MLLQQFDDAFDLWGSCDRMLIAVIKREQKKECLVGSYGADDVSGCVVAIKRYNKMNSIETYIFTPKHSDQIWCAKLATIISV